MKKFAVVFPGQGSQSVGMLKDFMGNKTVALTYEEANEALGFDLKKITLEGPEEQLNSTEITQPAILAASIAVFRVLKETGLTPMAFAGHSLGEYSALTASEVIDFADALKLVRLRGLAMQEAVPKGEGAMAAVLGLEDDLIENICKEVSYGDDAVWAANYNSPGQVVISGRAGAVVRATEKLQQAGAKKVVMLEVSAPSHCPLMQSAADRVKEALDDIKINNAVIPIFCNARAESVTLRDDIADCLYRQLIGPVRWVESVRNMAKSGVEVFLEAGPGRVLGGLIRRIDKSFNTAAIQDEDSLHKAVSLIEG